MKLIFRKMARMCKIIILPYIAEKHHSWPQILIVFCPLPLKQNLRMIHTHIMLHLRAEIMLKMKIFDAT